MSGNHWAQHATHFHRCRSHQALSTQLEGPWGLAPHSFPSAPHQHGSSTGPGTAATHSLRDFQKLTWSQQLPSILLLFTVLPSTHEYQHSWPCDTYKSATSSPVSLHPSPFSPVSPPCPPIPPSQLLLPQDSPVACQSSELPSNLLKAIRKCEMGISGFSIWQTLH